MPHGEVTVKAVKGGLDVADDDGHDTAVIATAAVTVRTVEPEMPVSVALMVEVPAATPVARPAAVIVATEVVAEAQVTWLVRFCVELSV